MIIHHTSGGGGVQGVVNTLHERGLSVQYGIDREGKTYRLLPEGADRRARGQTVLIVAISITATTLALRSSPRTTRT